MSNIYRLIMAVLLTTLVANPSALAQTVPSDLVEVSLEELFATNVLSDVQERTTRKRWHMSYRYATSRFDEYYLGSDSLTYEDVLWRPGLIRTGANYPVVPTEISQNVHALLLGYDFSDTLTLRVSVPYIEQSTDHISIVPGYDAFNISSSGLGDIVLLGDYVVNRTVNSVWRIGAGLSIPTGSIDEEGDTPRAPGDQQLPYTMQVGSGTYDIPLALVYEKYEDGFRWGASTRATLRTGENDRDYRLGHKASVEGWLSLTNVGPMRPGLKLAYRWQDKISGEDPSLRIPNPTYPYPAPVVDPDAFGGKQVDLALYVEADLGESGWSSRLEYSRPVYLDLNGPQTAEDYHLSITLGIDF